MFDLHIYSLNMQTGRETPDLPGSLTITPPRRTARGRDTDFVNVMLTNTGSAPMDAEETQTLVKQFAGIYYSTSGSVTHALRTAVEFLNNLILQRNLKGSREGMQVVGVLNAAILHDEQLFIAHCGRTHSYVASGSSVEEFTDDTTTDRGLGLSKGISPRFYTASLQPNDVLVFCAQPPASWNESTLAGAGALNLESLRRRLVNQAGGNVQAQVIRFAAGKGQILRRRLVDASQSSAAPAAPEKANPPETSPAVRAPTTPSADLEPSQHAEPLQDTLPMPASTLDEALSAGLPGMDGTSTSLEPPQSSRLPVGKTEAATASRPIRMQAKKDSQIKKSLAKAWLAGRDFRQKVDSGAKKVTYKIAPKLAVQKPSVSPSLMLFIAIAIPIIIVAIATTIYIQKGRATQHAYFVQQAQLSVNYALETQDLKAKIAYWEAALSFIDTAESYGISQDSTDLRTAIQQNLDMLGGMSHLQIRPAVSETLPGSMQITRFAIPLNDTSQVYFLDSAGGQVLHMTRKDQNTYSMDSSFTCSPDSVTPSISALVDMILLPPNAISLDKNSSGGAAVMAIDSSGNLLYCASGKSPLVMSLPVPSIGWGKIERIVLDSGSLYVLDSTNRRIWIYEGSNYTFNSAPVPFFDSQVPNNLGDIQGMAVNNLELYLLHADNLVTECTYSAFKKLKLTECKDPTQLYDLRTTTSPVPFVPAGQQFIQLEKQDLPDSALYILDANEVALYKFGYQLNLFHVFHFRPEAGYNAPSQPLSGFGMTTDRTVFLAFGSEIYFTQLQ